VRILLDRASARGDQRGPAMSDFEAMPIGTRERLEALQAYALKTSGVLAGLVGNAPELMTVVAGERLADPLFCGARIEARIRNAGRRYAGPGRRS
jgi:hypothetical protein